MGRKIKERNPIQQTQTIDAEATLASFDKRLRTLRTLRYCMFSYLIMFLPLGVYFLLGAARLVPLPPPVMCWTLLFVSVACWILPYIMYRSEREAVRAARALPEVNDLRAIGPLTQVVCSGDAKARNGAANRLMLLLPRLTEDDAALLSGRQRTALYRLLRPEYAMVHANAVSEFVLVILEALTKVGDGRAVPVAEKLAEYEATTYNQQRIQIQARACLPRLRALAERDRTGNTLLRPSQSPQTPAATYLRPARGVPEAEPAKLLRPDASDDEEQ